MRINGVDDGVAALKALAGKDREYLKFLINEARSNTDLRTTFRSAQGKAFQLRVDIQSGDLVVEEPAAR